MVAAAKANIPQLKRRDIENRRYVDPQQYRVNLDTNWIDAGKGTAGGSSDASKLGSRQRRP